MKVYGHGKIIPCGVCGKQPEKQDKSMSYEICDCGHGLCVDCCKNNKKRKEEMNKRI